MRVLTHAHWVSFLVALVVTTVSFADESIMDGFSDEQFDEDRIFLVEEAPVVRRRRFRRQRQQPINNLCPYALASIPKSGTHLVIKAMGLIGGGVPVWHHGLDPYIFRHLPHRMQTPYFPVAHFWQSPQVEAAYQQLGLKKIISIRDLRDVCVSTLNHILKWSFAGYDEKYPGVLARLKSLSYDDQLLFVINYEYKPASNQEWQTSFPLVFAQAVAYSKDPNVHVCRYEDLVGEQGGGTEEAQLAELRALAEFMGCNRTDDQLEDIAKLLYGDEYNPFGKRQPNTEGSTFQTGKIGGWKTVFKKQHKDAFKKKFGKALIALGYEKDDNW